MPLESRGKFGDVSSNRPKPLSKDNHRQSMKKDIPDDPGFDELAFYLKQQAEEQKGIDEVMKVAPPVKKTDEPPTRGATRRMVQL